MVVEVGVSAGVWVRLSTGVGAGSSGVSSSSSSASSESSSSHRAANGEGAAHERRGLEARRGEELAMGRGDDEGDEEGEVDWVGADRGRMVRPLRGAVNRWGGGGRDSIEVTKRMVR